MSNDNPEDKKGQKSNLSRRGIFGAMAGAAAAVPLVGGAAQAQGRGDSNMFTQSTPLRSTGAGAPITSTSLDGLPGQGGRGPIRVLFISSYHPFDRENLFRMLDRFGEDITWCHVEHPAAERFFDPAIAEDFDVFLFYDAFAGRKMVAGADGRRQTTYPPPSAKLQADLKKLLTNGDKGFVMFHHALASWCHSWPAGVNGSNAYVEMMGGAADWGMELANLRGKTYPRSGYRQGTEQRVTVVDKNHPVTAGVEDYDIVDETYLCPIFEDSVHPLLRSSFKPTADKFAHAPNGSNVGAGHPPGSDLVGWVKTAENTPLVYIQHGHDNNAWGNPHFQRLMLNAIKWAASPEAKTWAKANAKRIFV
jgi:type 1 glutamine amidotransferase